MLIEAASAKWGILPTQCYAENAKVFRKDNGQSFTYGELVEVASKLNVPQEPVLKQKNEFKILGKPARRLDLHDRVTGKAVYGLDNSVSE